MKCWVGKTGKPEIISECFVDMKNWAQARDILYNYAHIQQATPVHSKKQSIMLIPSKLEELEKGNEILDRIKANAQAQQQPKPWWNLW